jgi:Protein of unknown function (DUF4232)
LPILTAACSRAASSTPPTEPALNFPTLAPGSLPLCQPADLDISPNSENSNGELVMGVSLTNNTKQICALSNPPHIRLLDGNKNPIDLHALDASGAQTPPVPAFMQIAPGENVIVTVIWQNYCQPTSIKSVFLSLALANDQSMDIGVNTGAVPDCTSANEASTLLVEPYSSPP